MLTLSPSQDALSAAIAKYEASGFRLDKECGNSNIPDTHTCHVGKGTSKPKKPSMVDIAAEGLTRSVLGREKEYPKGKEQLFLKDYKEDVIPLVKKYGRNWGIKVLSDHLELDQIDKAIREGEAGGDEASLRAYVDISKQGLSRLNKDRVNALLRPRSDPSFGQEVDRIMAVKQRKGRQDRELYQNIPSTGSVLNQYLEDINFEVSDGGKASIYTSELRDLVKRNPKGWGRQFFIDQLELGKLQKRVLMADVSEQEARRLVGVRVKRQKPRRRDSQDALINAIAKYEALGYNLDAYKRKCLKPETLDKRGRRCGKRAKGFIGPHLPPRRKATKAKRSVTPDKSKPGTWEVGTKLTRVDPDPDVGLVEATVTGVRTSKTGKTYVEITTSSGFKGSALQEELESREWSPKKKAATIPDLGPELEGSALNREIDRLTRKPPKAQTFSLIPKSGQTLNVNEALATETARIKKIKDPDEKLAAARHFRDELVKFEPRWGRKFGQARKKAYKLINQTLREVDQKNRPKQTTNRNPTPSSFTRPRGEIARITTKTGQRLIASIDSNATGIRIKEDPMIASPFGARNLDGVRLDFAVAPTQDAVVTRGDGMIKVEFAYPPTKQIAKELQDLRIKIFGAPVETAELAPYPPMRLEDRPKNWYISLNATWCVDRTAEQVARELEQRFGMKVLRKLSHSVMRDRKYADKVVKQFSTTKQLKEMQLGKT